VLIPQPLLFYCKKAIGDQLTCMFIDQGFMRKGEPEFLMDFFDRKFNIHVEYINARERFINKLDGVTDPEEKRKSSALNSSVCLKRRASASDPSITSPRAPSIPM
jgi:GMP synthase PP-ATPase subunit